MSNNSRRGFLKTIIAGIAAAPAVAAAESLSGKAPASSDQILARKWEKGGIKFTEYTMPQTIPPHFVKEGEKTARWITAVPFSLEYMKSRGQSIPELIERAVKAHCEWARQPDGEVVARVGARGRKFESQVPLKDVTNVTIVRVHGMPNVMAIVATTHPLIPRKNCYQVKTMPDCKMPKMKKQVVTTPGTYAGTYAG